MPIDFFKNNCNTNSNKKLFGLYDDPPPAQNPAYIIESDNQNWIAEVKNCDEKAIDFYAIDNCIDIFRPNGEMEKRCDGMLHYENKLVFIELKNRGHKGWISGGADQLVATIKMFKLNHDISTFNEVRTFICNKQKPMVFTNTNTVTQKLKDATGLTLEIYRKIII